MLVTRTCNADLTLDGLWCIVDVTSECGRKAVITTEISVDTEQIRHLREALGYTQQDLAERMGVSRATVNQIEAGRRLPTLQHALVLARELGVTVEDMVVNSEATPA